MDEYEAEIRRQYKQMSEVESSNIKLESDLKMRFKQAEAKSFGLDKQLSNIMNELNQKDVSLNDANKKLRELQKEFEICKIKLDEKQRSCDMKVTDFEITKAKELSALKRKISLSQQIINENRTITESQSKELSGIKEEKNFSVACLKWSLLGLDWKEIQHQRCYW